jgi:hypothetical protein
MTDLEISKALALAIGWTTVDALFYGDAVAVGTGSNWRRFDYRDWNVIGPIAEKFNCFPSCNGLSKTWWPPRVVKGKDVGHIMQDTPQKAIAMAVIGAQK